MMIDLLLSEDFRVLFVFEDLWFEEFDLRSQVLQLTGEIGDLVLLLRNVRLQEIHGVLQFLVLFQQIIHPTIANAIYLFFMSISTFNISNNSAS